MDQDESKFVNGWNLGFETSIRVRIILIHFNPFCFFTGAHSADDLCCAGRDVVLYNKKFKKCGCNW